MDFILSRRPVLPQAYSVLGTEYGRYHIQVSWNHNNCIRFILLPTISAACPKKTPSVFPWFRGSTKPRAEPNSTVLTPNSATAYEVPGMNGAIVVFEFGSVVATADKVTLVGYCPVVGRPRAFSMRDPSSKRLGWMRRSFVCFSESRLRG
ncbi:hypothetical protein SAY87_011562 [Trapa incisa]|uniref:Uncharacterized protein n=1 Tax=Trapa incisa TaxID=236973 RepID=A0AAN7GFR8_9MYRT|nr:hypothetical protein SAY87_011562 [Trapa incisa]